MKKSAIAIGACLLWVLFFVLCLNAGAQERLKISPTRAILDSAHKVQEISVTNTSRDTLHYILSFMEMQMNDAGKLEPASPAAENLRAASEFAAVYPDRLDLAPGASQTVRLMLVNTNRLTNGEYRSHLFLKQDHSLLPTGLAAVAFSKGSSVTLPVIVRQGDYDANLSLGNVTYRAGMGSPFLNVTVNRAGSMSAYGNLVVSYPDAQGNFVEVGALKGVALYTPNTSRQFKVPLTRIPGVTFVSSRFNVAFITADGNNMLAPAVANVTH